MKKKMFVITSLLAVMIATLFIIQVMLVRKRKMNPNQAENTNSESEEPTTFDEAKEGVSEAINSGGDVISASSSMIGSIFGMLSISIIFAVLGLMVLTALGLGIASFGNDLSGSFDEAFSEVWPPFYRGVVLGIADPVLSIWNVVIPISNSMTGSWRILRSNALNQALDCPGADWGDAALKLRDTILALLNSIISWILDLGRDDFDSYTPLRSMQLVIESVAPVTACWCEATTKVGNIGQDALTSHEAAALLDRALNLIINFWKDLLGSLFNILKAFGQALLSGGNFTQILGEYYWEPNRAPSFERTVRSLGQLNARFGDWLDDIGVSIGTNLFNLLEDDIPRLFGIFGNYAESVWLMINVVIDALTKPLRYFSLLGTRYDDVVWEKSRPVALRTQDLLGDAFAKAYNASLLSEEFFQTWTVPLAQLNDSALADKAQILLNLTGCMSHEILDVGTALLEMTLRSIVATFHERLIGGDYSEYLRDPPFGTAIDVALSSSVRYGNCAGAFYSQINDEFGRLVNESGHVVIAIIEPFVALHENWNNRSHFWNSSLYDGLVTTAFFELDGWSIAMGNFIRQFAFINTTVVDPDIDCLTRNPHSEQGPPGTAPDIADWEAFYPWYVDPFCCLGGAFEEFFRLFFGFFEGVTLAIKAFVIAPTLADGFIESFQAGGPLDLRVEFIPMVDFLLRDLFRFSCIKFGIGRAIADAYFDAPAMPCGSGGDSFWEISVEVSTGMIRTPFKVVVGGAAEIWSWMVELAKGTSCDETCWCTRLRSFYAITGGEFTDWIADFLDLIACLFGHQLQILTRLTNWATTLRNLAGSTGTLATGNFFCLIADFFVTIWDLFACWANGGGFITCILDTVLVALDDLLDALVDCLRAIWPELKNIILCIPTNTWKWVQALFGDVRCLFDKSNPCPNLLNYMKSCRFVIPSECGAGSLGLTTGSVGISGEDLQTETYSRIISNCDNLPYLSEEWIACIASATNTETATLTRYVEFDHIVKRSQKISAIAGNLTGPLSGDRFGTSVCCIGDLNVDGYLDIVVGAPYDTDGGSNRGAVYVLFLDGTGRVESEQKISDLVGSFGGALVNEDFFGISVTSLGDLDGDGNCDIAVGAYGVDGTGTDQGAVWILFLSDSGTVLSEQQISDSAGNFTGYIANFDWFGWSVASIGDLNEDGVPDLAVGAVGGGASNRGAVWILFLASDGIVQMKQEITDGTGGFAGTLSADDNFGNSIARLGDLNSDGVEDLVVGAYGTDTGGSNTGAIWLLFMNPDGTVNDDPIDGREIGVNTPPIGEFIGSGDRFGSSVAGIGDLDGDGIPDMIVGADADDDGGIDSGAIYLIYLYSDGTIKTFSKISSNQGGLRDHLDVGSRFGGSITAIGDLDRDSVVDIAVGARRDGDGASDNGAVYVIYLGAETTRFRKAGDSVRDEKKISSTVGGFSGIIDNKDLFGRSLALLGDLNGDGSISIAVGAPGDDNGGIPQFPVDDYGAVWILSLDASSHTVKSYQKLSNSSGGLVLGPNRGDQYGRGIASIGDLDGDNITDLVVGADFDADGGSARGALWIVFLHANGTSKMEQKISDTQGGFSGGLNFLDSFAVSVASVGDLDGDNVTDIAVGAPGDDDGGTNRGAVWILFLHSNGTVKSHAKISNLTTLSDFDQFGHSIALIPDLDGDGIDDLAVGANFDDGGGNDRGAVHIVFLKANGTIGDTQKISDTSGGFVGVLSDYYFFGSSVASNGDLDGDGVSDLVVGATGDNDGGINRGAVWILFLRIDGTVLYHKKISYFEGGFLGILDDNDWFGDGLSFIGDIDGDGISELAVGTPKNDDGSIDPESERGALWILYLNDIIRESSLVLSYSKVSETKGNFNTTFVDNDRFGWALVSLGDLNLDGTSDLAVSAMEDDDGGTNRGAIWILFMTPNGTVQTQQKISDTEGNFGGVLTDLDQFGSALAVLGDLDGDNITDIAVGARSDDGGGSNRGAVWILFLHSNGTVLSEQKITDTAGNFGGVLLDDDQFGTAIAVLGDLDGDNVTDIAVGAFTDDDGGNSRGAVWILFMLINGTVSSEQKISDTAGDFTGILADGDLFGASVGGLGDLNLDGIPDLAVGAIGTDYGTLWILFLHSNGTVESHHKIDESSGDITGPLRISSEFGSSVQAIGDLNGDGITDLAVGSAFDSDGGTARGAVWLLLMNRDGTVKSTSSSSTSALRFGPCAVPETETKISYLAGGFIAPMANNENFGKSLAALGDFDGDGVVDLAVGGPGNTDGGGSGRGAFWILNLKDLTDLLFPTNAHPVKRMKHSSPQLRNRESENLESQYQLRGLDFVQDWQQKRLNESFPSSSSSSVFPFNEVIEFEDIEQWCLYEGTQLGLLQEAQDINENSTQIMEDQKEINRRVLNASIYQMSMSYQACLASSTVARIVDISIGFVSKNETLVDPKTFYDPFRFMYFVSRILQVGPVVLEYHFARVNLDPTTLSGSIFLEYLETTHNITDPLTTNLGLFGDRMIRAARTLVQANKGNIIGYVVNTWGEFFYSGQDSPTGPSMLGGGGKKRSRTIYDAAPLHPKGWQSSKWIEFQSRYIGGIMDGYKEWQIASGFEDLTWTFDYLTELPTLYQRRVKWNRDGRDPASEPYPAGRLAQRAKFEGLLDREIMSQQAWESDQTAEIRSVYARNIRQIRYPSLEAELVIRDQRLIPEDIVCPTGTGNSDHNCTSRICWSADGASVGSCVHRSDLFGRPVCGCTYDSLGGACCGDTGCTDEIDADACGSDSVFAPNRTCAMLTTCTAARGACCASNGTCSTVSLDSRCPGNSTFLIGSECSACLDDSLIKGACCTSGICTMTTETACSTSDGTWNSRRNCSSRFLSGACGHCGASPCLSCDLLFATVNDIVDLWILNMELINQSANGGACCYGTNATNRSCAVTARSTCDDLVDSTWFWGEQCSFCQTPFILGAFAVAALILHLQDSISRLLFLRLLIPCATSIPIWTMILGHSF